MEEEFAVSLIVWLLLGVIAGLVAHRLSGTRRGSRALDVILGIAGSLSGGLMFYNFGGDGFAGFDIHSMVVAAIGALAALLTYHALFVYPGDSED